MFKNGKETNYEQNLLKVFALQNDHFCVDKLMILNYLPTQYLLAYEYVLIPIKLFNIKQCNALYKLNQITFFFIAHPTYSPNATIIIRVYTSILSFWYSLLKS